MIFTLHRYILRDLFKTFALATFVLSVMLGLGVMFQPLRQFGVTPESIPELLLYTFPITLTMVLPIAALLAATINYGRLTADNEINACRSSGIGLWTLIYPALILALLVGLASLALGFNVIPRFARQFDYLLKRDAETLIYRNIQRNGDLSGLGASFENFKIHADSVNPARHQLTNVAVMDVEGRRTYTMKEARVEVRIGEETNQIFLQLIEPMISEQTETGTIESQSDLFTLRYDFPSLFQDDIKFKKLSELQALQEKPTLFTPVRRKLERVQEQVLVERYCQWAREQLESRQTLNLRQGTNRLEVIAPHSYVRLSNPKVGKTVRKRVTGVALEALASQPVEVVVREPSSPLPIKRYRADVGELSLNEDANPPVASLTLKNVEVIYPGSRIPPSRLLIETLNGMAIAPELLREVKDWPLEVYLAGQTPVSVGASEYLQSLIQLLERSCRDMQVEIRVELHMRLAFGFSCVALVLLGTALGIRLKSSHVLTAFGISFVPAALCLMAIFSGQHIAEQNADGATGGILFLWSGIVSVGLIDWFLYKRLFKT